MGITAYGSSMGSAAAVMIGPLVMIVPLLTVATEIVGTKSSFMIILTH